MREWLRRRHAARLTLREPTEHGTEQPSTHPVSIGLDEQKRRGVRCLDPLDVRRAEHGARGPVLRPGRSRRTSTASATSSSGRSSTRDVSSSARSRTRAIPTRGFDQAFDVLGDLGLYMASLRRHELTNPAARGALAARGGDGPRPAHRRIGRRRARASRRATSRRTTSRATGARRASPRCRTSTSSSTTTRAGSSPTCVRADALMRIPPLGISHAVAETLFDDARRALEDVGKFNDVLFAELDVDRFFYSVRPVLQAVSRRVVRSTAARTPATSRASTRSTCCSASVAGTTRTTRSSSSRRCSSCTRLTRRACATACGGEASSTSSSTRSTTSSEHVTGSSRNADRVPPRLRGARAGRRAAPRPARRAVHRGAVAGARREPPRAGDGERTAAPGAALGARGAARSPPRRATRRHRVAPRGHRAPRGCRRHTGVAPTARST